LKVEWHFSNLEPSDNKLEYLKHISNNDKNMLLSQIKFSQTLSKFTYMYVSILRETFKFFTLDSDIDYLNRYNLKKKLIHLLKSKGFN